jgi:hypothetical protein
MLTEIMLFDLLLPLLTLYTDIDNRVLVYFRSATKLILRSNNRILVTKPYITIIEYSSVSSSRKD